MKYQLYAMPQVDVAVGFNLNNSFYTKEAFLDLNGRRVISPEDVDNIRVINVQLIREIFIAIRVSCPFST